MLKQQIRPRFAKGKEVVELIAESLNDEEYIGKRVRFSSFSEGKIVKGTLIKIVPIEEVYGEKYGKRAREEQGIQYGYIVSYSIKTPEGMKEVIEGAKYIYEV